MRENNSNKIELLLREVLNEKILRDVFLFVLFYLFLLAQGWDRLLILLFPIISFSFALFFRVIGTNKKRIINDINLLIYNPIGAENKYADRLTFVSLLQLILLFWIGAESLYHPQLIDDFALYFNLTFFLIYSFGYFWIFVGIWNYCKFIIDLSNLEQKDFRLEKILISELKFSKIKLISFLNIITFIVLNLVNIIFTLVNQFGTSMGFPHNLPGTGIEDSLPLYLNYSVYIILIVFPLITVIFLYSVYRDVNSFSKTDFKVKISNLPSEVQTQIMENLRSINKKFYENSTE